MRKVKLIIALKHEVHPDTDFKIKAMIKGIQLRTRSKYYHSEIIIEDRWVSSDFDGKGVRISPLRPLKPNWEYIDLGEVYVTDEQYEKIWKWIEAQVGQGYDFLAIAMSQLFNLNWHSKDKWICSEITSKIAQLFLVLEYLNINPNQISPADIAKIHKLPLN